MDAAEGHAPDDRPELQGACLKPRDWLAAGAILSVTLVLYAATRQDRVYGHDGAFLINAFVSGLEGHSNSALYATVGEWMRDLVPQRWDLARPLYWLSHLGGSIGVAAVFLLARALGATRRGALLGASLLALAPAHWFYATTIETHPLHVAAVGIAALVCVLGPWTRPLLARGLSAAAFVLLYPTHMTGLLLAPGWPLLARAGRARRATPLPFARDVALLSLALVASLVFSIALANHLFGAGFVLLAGDAAPTRFLEQFTERFRLEALWSGWALALFLLLPTGAWALAAGEPRGEARRALLTLILVPTLVLLWLSIPERGAYFLGSAVFLAVLAAFAPLPSGARGWALGGLLVLLQGIAGRGELVQYGHMFPLDERVEVIHRNLGDEGVLITLNPNVPRTQAYLAGVVDYDLAGPMTEFLAQGKGPEEFADFLEGEIRRIFPARAVALDLSYRRLYEEPPELLAVVQLDPYLFALEQRLTDAFNTRLVSHEWWPLLVLEP